MLKYIYYITIFLLSIGIANAFNYSSGTYQGELTVLDSGGQNISSSDYATIIAFSQLDYLNISSGDYSTQLGVLHHIFDDVSPVISTPPPGGGGGGGGGGDLGGNLVNVSENLTQPIANNTCAEGYQFLDSVCYPCDPTKGYLIFNTEDRSVLCIMCADGFLLNGTSCYEDRSQFTYRRIIYEEIDKFVNDLSGKLKIGMALGYMLFFLVLGYSIWKFIVWLKKREKKKGVPSEEEEDGET